MINKQQLEKMGATPSKLALIGILSVVLVGVIVMQLPDENAASTVANDAPSRAPSGAQARQQVSTPANVTIANKETKELQPWPQADLSELLSNDPFALPTWAVQEKEAAAKQQPSELVELQKQGASIVMITKDGKTATIGDQKVRIGDVLKGYRITDITTQGIVLDKLETH